MSGDRVPPASTPGGLFDANPWPAHLVAHVVDPGPSARVHGYEVDGDLARHYRYSDLLRLALTGELPSESEGRALDLALVLLAPVDVSAAPAHAGVLAGTCAARSSATIGIAALALAEHARHVVAEHAALLVWLDAQQGDFPATFVATTEDDAEAAARVQAAASAAYLEVPSLSRGPTRMAALLSILHASGLRRPEQIEAALVIAQLPCVLAEAFAAEALPIRSYPALLPPYRYEATRV